MTLPQGCHVHFLRSITDFQAIVTIDIGVQEMVNNLTVGATVLHLKGLYAL
jgi:hypothetical protein